MLKLPPDQEKRLVELIVAAFDADSLHELMRLEMGVDMYKELVPTGQTLRNSVLDLVISLTDRGLLAIFLEKVIAARPSRADIQAEIPVMAQQIATNLTSSQEQVTQVKEALISVSPGEISSEDRSYLSELRHELDLMETYKGLHDCLHRAQMHLSPLETEARSIGVPGQEDAADRFIECLDTFRREGMEAQKWCERVPAEPSFLRSVENQWIERWLETATKARAALAEANNRNARLAAKQFRSLLRTEPSRIDGILRTIADDLKFEALRRLLLSLDGHNTASAESAEQLFRRLKALVNQHNQWQGIQQSLWEAEDQLPESADSDTMDFSVLWEDVQRSLALLIANAPQAAWAAEASQWSATATKAYQAIPLDPKPLSRAFKQFRRSCMMVFFAVDSDLKAQAETVARLRDTLADLST